MSHFSTIKTQLKEAEPLVKALKHLGYSIHQDGRVEETVEGFTGNSCNEATKNLEDALGKVTVKNKTSGAFISNQSENLTQLNNESNVTF